MSDREPGVFYLIKRIQIETTNPWGWHDQIRIKYYRDYGKTLEATFWHNLTKDYVYEEVVCNNTTHLGKTTVNENSVLLQWTTKIDTSLIRGYHVYRNNERITDQLLTKAEYLDENLPCKVCEYFVRTYFKEGCVSDASNKVYGFDDVSDNKIKIYPNPTTGELVIINNEQLIINNVGVLDILGRKVLGYGVQGTGYMVIDVSELAAGVYFVRVVTEKGVFTERFVKQ